MFAAVMQGAVFAFVPLGVYLSIPAVLDRYDPEPWWCLAMAFFWGAVVATGFAGFINTGVHIAVASVAGKEAGQIVSTVISAPLCEELFKGMAVFGTFFFLRREFDGIVDGIIYGHVRRASAFAAVENISYYARAESCTARCWAPLLPPRRPRALGPPPPLHLHDRHRLRHLARVDQHRGALARPFGGYCVGVTLHAIWNFVPTVFGDAFWYLIPLWLLFVMAFFGIVVALVIRKGRTMYASTCRDEVLIGNLSQEEVDLITSPVGRLKCTFSWRGATGRAFIGAGAAAGAEPAAHGARDEGGRSGPSAPTSSCRLEW